MVHMLEQEGVILLMPGQSPGQRTIVPVYDLLGGYFIADSILTKHGHSSFEQWLNDPAVQATLSGNVTESHPLAHDVFRALNGLVPRRSHHQQLWQMLNGDLRTAALRLCPLLEAAYIDAATVAAIAEDIRLSGSPRMFGQLRATRSAVGHPLNADFLDAVLRSMPVADRDLSWTEWIRSDYAEPWHRPLDIEGDVRHLEERWKNNHKSRTASDRLRAKWLIWGLTTTVRNLRDRITRALYWFGRGDPASLFTLAEQAADINDPYVFERTLAASYGVAMAIHADPSLFPGRRAALSAHARKMFELMFNAGAPARTTHVLIREYARRLIDLGVFHDRKLFSSQELTRARPPYSDGGRISWPDVAGEEGEVWSKDSPFHMDFENYTLGSLAEGRPNYDFKHAGYLKIRAQVLWRVGDLGWTAERFGKVDDGIESRRHSYSRAADEPGKVDRYGKKYSLIASLELRGWLADQGLLKKDEWSERTSRVDIDPSFPDPAPEFNLVSTSFLGKPSLTLPEWISHGPTPNLKRCLQQQTILGESGPWVMLDGFVTQEDESRGRRIFAFISSFLVANKDAAAFNKCLAKQPLGGRWLPEKPRTFHTFAGEAPWCSIFPDTASTTIEFKISEHTVKVRRKKQFLYLDGKQLGLTPLDVLLLRAPRPVPESLARRASLSKEDLARAEVRDRVVEVQEIRSTLRRFHCIIPVVDCNWEGRDVENRATGGITLTKQLARSAELAHLPQTHDLQTSQGVRATYGTVTRPHDYTNSERLFFIRKETLDSILSKCRLSMVWAVWGEREVSSGQLHRAEPGGDLAGNSYASFQKVHPY
jgi:hypothetical protein